MRPHAVSAITGTVAGLTNPAFNYDANGNLQSGLGRNYTWSSYNQPASIDKLSGSTAVQRTSFLLGPDHERVRQTVSPVSGGVVGSPTSTLWYAGAIEKEIDFTAATTTLRTYTGGGYIEEKFSGTTIASTASGTRNPKYVLSDHLGSPIAVTDSAQAVAQRMAYDAWGRRRNTDGSDDASASLGSLANGQDHRGFTGQEQLDQLALVHLNGRIYDPIAARMTSADPIVPDPHDVQHLNRYSYVTNNALAFVDPSGYAPAYLTPADSFSTGPMASSARGWGLNCSGLSLLCGRWRPRLKTEVEAGGASYWAALSMSDPADDIAGFRSQVRSIEEDMAAFELGWAIADGARINAMNNTFAQSSTSDTATASDAGSGDIENCRTMGCTNPRLSTAASDVGKAGAAIADNAAPVLKEVGKEAAITAAGASALKIVAIGGRYFWIKGGRQVLGEVVEGARGLRELPALDATGKVHGMLPAVKDLKRYDVDSLTRLRDELKVSVQRRIEVTVQKGSDFGHAERQAAEQQLIKSIEKHLEVR